MLLIETGNRPYRYSKKTLGYGSMKMELAGGAGKQPDDPSEEYDFIWHAFACVAFAVFAGLVIFA
jgi:hypothetical protein